MQIVIYMMQMSVKANEGRVPTTSVSKNDVTRLLWSPGVFSEAAKNYFLLDILRQNGPFSDILDKNVFITRFRANIFINYLHVQY